MSEDKKKEKSKKKAINTKRWLYYFEVPRKRLKKVKEEKTDEEGKKFTIEQEEEVEDRIFEQALFRLHARRIAFAPAIDLKGEQREQRRTQQRSRAVDDTGEIQQNGRERRDRHDGGVEPDLPPGRDLARHDG